MKRKNGWLLTIGILCVGLSIWQIYASLAGLDVVNLHTTNPPVTIITPSNARPASRPTILIAHGFAGSSVLMRGFALTLAHAGYTTVSWDFQGHGANPNPMIQSSESNSLLLTGETALKVAKAMGVIDTQRIAILGHSMGSGVALSWAVSHPNTFATIAISPGYQFANPTLPHNLLLMAGSLEPQFVTNAEELLSRGGVSSDIVTVAERELVIIPNVEHISILFSPTAHSTARSWLNETFGIQSGAINYTDRRIFWFGLGIVGFILLANAFINIISQSNQSEVRVKPLWLRAIALFVGGITATIFLWLVGMSGLKLSQFMGLLVGGYILVWFGVAGAISLIIFRPQISLLKTREIIVGLVAFAGLWLGVGLLGNFVWLPWLLIPYRLWLWIPASILLFPWFFSVAEAAKPARPIGQLGWWLFQTVVIFLSLYLATTINSDLGFIFIILPLVPVMIGLHLLVISPKRGTWSYAMAGSMFTAWLILAVFPLQ